MHICVHMCMNSMYFLCLRARTGLRACASSNSGRSGSHDTVKTACIRNRACGWGGWGGEREGRESAGGGWAEEGGGDSRVGEQQGGAGRDPEGNCGAEG